MKKALVTGGLGFTGSHLVCYLASQGREVIAYDNRTRPVGLPLVSGLLREGGNVKIVSASTLDVDALRHWCRTERVDVIYNLFATALLGEWIDFPIEPYLANDKGTLNVCSVARELGIKVVYTGSSEALGTALYVPMDEAHPYCPTTVYGASKAAGEIVTQSFTRCYGMESAVPRLFNTYGSHLHTDKPHSSVLAKFILRASQNKPLQIQGDGHQTRDFIYVEDAVRGIVLAGERYSRGEVIHIARGEEVSMLDLAGLVIKHYEEQGVFAQNRPIEFLPERLGDVRRHFADVSKAKRELGFDASVGIKEGVELTCRWYDDNERAKVAAYRRDSDMQQAGRRHRAPGEAGTDRGRDGRHRGRRRLTDTTSEAWPLVAL